MKRIALIGLLLVAATAFVALSTGASEPETTGEFKVELDNAFGLIEQGDMKVAGVRAGEITELEVDKETKRAIVSFTVTETGFGSLREDASCEVMPQSLVGEYFVNCVPGTSDKELEPGSTIPVERTASTVPPDLVTNIMRRPRRERLRLILNELGAAVAGNAENLNAALRRASPALRETNRVLAILADQNQVLADLARDADQVVGALAENRTDVARWVDEARDTARASAERDDDIRRGFELLPTFLAELEPTMEELGNTAERQGPALENLSASAEQLETLFENLPGFADATRPALKALGRASDTGREAVRPATATVEELRKYAEGVPELGKNLAIVLEHLDDRDNAVEKDPRSPGGEGYTGLEALLQYVFDQQNSTNIHDGEVHILKASAFEGECAPYADLKAAEELAERCGRFLGPNPLGFVSPDPTRPPGWDGNDHGPESSDPNNRRIAPPDRDLVSKETEDRLRDERKADANDGAREQRDEPKDDGPVKPPVRIPKLDDVLPGEGTPRPPAVPDLPNLGGLENATATREDQENSEQLMDFLFGS